MAMSTPRKPRHPKGKKTSEKIIRAGRQLIIEKGYHKVVADDIAKSAGFSVGTFYSYFKDKRDLLIQLISCTNASIEESISEKIKELAFQAPFSIHDFVRQSLRIFLTIHKDNGKLFEEFDIVAQRDQDVFKLIHQSDLNIIEVLNGLFQSMFPEMDDDERGNTAKTVFYTSQGIIHSPLNLHGRDKSVQTEFEEMMVLYLEQKVLSSPEKKRNC